MTRYSAFAACLVTCASLTGCPGAGESKSGPTEAAAGTPAAGKALAAEDVAKVTQAYVELLEGDYRAALEGARELEKRVGAFCEAPSAEGLEAARKAWLAARPAYQRTEIGRFYDGPIDREGGPEGDVNPWPLDEVYIDGTPEKSAGIVGSPERYAKIDEATIRGANGQGGEENVSTGWHAIEYLLWGVDQNPDGPGQRDWRDFQDGGSRPHPERRREYLKVVAQMLVSDLEGVHKEWVADGAYRKEFLGLEPNEALRRILTGIGTLAKGELRGERILTPYTSKEQEDEHSCFSDTTHVDHAMNLAGITNVWRKCGLRELSLGAGFDVKGIDEALGAAEAAMQDPAFKPFDKAILGADDAPGRQAITKAMKGLARFDAELTRLSEALGVKIVTTLPG